MPKESRVPLPALTVEQRTGGFTEIELGYTEWQAKREAGRCLSCGCQDVFDCRLRDLATRYGVRDERICRTARRYPNIKTTATSTATQQVRVMRQTVSGSARRCRG